MHKTLKFLSLAGAATALAITPAMAGAQGQGMPDTAPQTTPPSMPGTGTTATPPTAPATNTAERPSDTTTETYPDAAEGEPQGTMPENAAPDGTTDQAAKMQSWPPELQTSYKTWSPETQTYYWSLTEPRQEMFWRLTDADKARLAALPEPQQETAWAQIEASVEKMDS